MKKQTFLSFLLFLSFVISFAAFTSVSAREWEVGWPDLPMMESPTNLPTEEKLTLSYVFTYIFTFALLIVGIIAFLMLIISAVRYMMSTAMPSEKAAAMGQMRNIGFGLLLLMGSYILLNTLNPELLTFGLEEKDFFGASPMGTITLYKNSDCSDDGTQLSLYADPNLQDNGGWNDEAVTFKISAGLIARICANVNHTSCNVYIGDGTTCRNTATEGFTPGTPAGITSVQGEGLVDFVRLILFESADCEGESQIFSDSVACNPITGTFTGDSYWLYKAASQNYEAILCRKTNWNSCTNEIPPTSALSCNNQSGITSICVYEEDSPSSCVGAFLYEEADTSVRDFVPHSYLSCKNLRISSSAPAVWKMVGDNCRVTVDKTEDCGETLETSETYEGNNNARGTTTNPVKSATGGLLFGY